MKPQPKLRVHRPTRPTRAQRGSDLWFAPISIAVGIGFLWAMHLLNAAGVLAPVAHR